jgi:hypothetical protein
VRPRNALCANDRFYVGESLVLQLHAWDKEDHPNLINRDAAPVGHGVLVWFEVDDFTAVVARATQLRADVLLAPFVNENAQHNEIFSNSSLTLSSPRRTDMRMRSTLRRR